MKRSILAIAVILAGASTAQAYNWNSRASYNAEWARQHARIMDGRRSGALSAWEFRHVHSRLHSLAAYHSPAALSGHSKHIHMHKTN